MTTLGLEIRDSAAAPVAVDASGVIAARPLVESTGDHATAALQAVDTLAATVGSGPLGIAASLREGSPMLGAGSRAASIAWMALNPEEREDYRKLGCFEAEVAAAGIVRRLYWRIKAGDRSAAASLVIVSAPQMLVGGLMTTAADLLSEPVRVELARRLPGSVTDALVVVPAALGEDAVAIGAARIATAALK